jgi:hypothetical protein
MTDDKELQTGEAKAGRFFVRIAVVLGWAIAGYLLYTQRGKTEASPIMLDLIIGFCGVMAVVSVIQAMGGYGQTHANDDENKG